MSSNQKYYQVHYGGGEWSDKWYKVSSLFTHIKYALHLLEALGFEWTSFSDGSKGFLQTRKGKEAGDDFFIPHWSTIEQVNIER